MANSFLDAVQQLTRNWAHDLIAANLEMRDSDQEATLEADLKASESFLNQSTLQLESYAMSRHTQEQHAADWPCDHLTGKHAQALQILVHMSTNITCDHFVVST